MDKEQFEQFVEQVAITKNAGPNGAVVKKRIKQIRLEINEWGEEVEIEEEVEGYNPTIPPLIKNLKPVERACQLGCGKIIEDQRCTIRLYPTPKPHFRTHCVSCMKWVNPYGKIVGPTQIDQDYREYFSDRDK